MMVIVVVGGVILGLFSIVLYRSSAYKVRLEKFRKMIDEKSGAAALPGLKALLNKKYDSIEVHYLLGKAYLQAELYEKAVKELDFVQSLNMREKYYSQIEVAHSLATAYEKIGDYKNAQGTLLVALKHSPMEFQLLVQVAEIFMRRGMPKHASDYMEMALKIDPENSSLLLSMAKMLERANDLRGALVYAEKACKYDKGLAEAFQMVARLYYSFSNYKQAEKYYGKLAGLDGQQIAGVLGKAECLLAQGSRSGALYLMEKALRNCRKDLAEALPVMYKIAMIYINDTDVVKGIGLLEKIESLKSGYKDVKKYLEKYSDFRSNDQLAEYAFVGNEEFAVIAERLLKQMGTLQHKSKVVKKRDFVYYATFEDTEFRENVYIYFSRKMSPLTEWELREITNEIRLIRMRRGVVFCVGGFTREAAQYAASRSLSLIDRGELVRMLHSSTMIPLSAVS